MRLNVSLDLLLIKSNVQGIFQKFKVLLDLKRPVPLGGVEPLGDEEFVNMLSVSLLSMLCK